MFLSNNVDRKIGKPKKKSIIKKEDSMPENNEFKNDMKFHGGWWKLDAISNDRCKGGVAIEVVSFSTEEECCYLLPLDNGLFTVGPARKNGEPPSEDEILSCMVLSDSKLSLKTGY